MSMSPSFLIALIAALGFSYACTFFVRRIKLGRKAPHFDRITLFATAALWALTTAILVSTGPIGLAELVEFIVNWIDRSTKEYKLLLPLLSTLAALILMLSADRLAHVVIWLLRPQHRKIDRSFLEDASQSYPERQTDRDKGKRELSKEASHIQELTESARRIRDRSNEAIEEINKRLNAAEEPLKVPDTKAFIYYVHSLGKELLKSSISADRKASILLDKGTAYARNGIYFYILSIVAWQALAYVSKEMRPQYIYGIASCSLIFIFIEFLSAWYLRQYRHYVDTETYLLKLKATVDRYLFAYSAAKEAAAETTKAKTERLSGAFAPLNKMLTDPLQFPETQVFNFGTESFAKEAATAFKDVAANVTKKEP